MIKVKKISTWPCKQAACFKPAVYRFTDIEKKTPKGSIAEHISTVTLGHSCEHHVEEVNKLLKEIHYKEETDDT